MKICTSCKQLKALDEFSRRSDNPDKYRSNCKSCRRKSSAKYRTENIDKALESERRYRKENPEKRYLSCKVWNDKNRDKCYSYVKSYRERNPYYALSKNQLRRKTIIDNGAVEDIQFYDLYLLHSGLCYVCGCRIDLSLKHPHSKSKSIEHVLAISVGGTHTLENLAVSHLGCNITKGGG